jgi:hypothetical protein
MKTLMATFAAFMLGVFLSPIIRPSSALAQEGAVVYSPRAIPQVPNVGLTNLTDVVATQQFLLQIDGMHCITCKVSTGSTMKYSGGMFQLDSLAVEGSPQFEFQGAALNTVILLNAFHLLGGCSTKAPIDVTPRQPMIQTASFSKGTQITVASVGVAK